MFIILVKFFWYILCYCVRIIVMDFVNKLDFKAAGFRKSKVIVVLRGDFMYVWRYE